METTYIIGIASIIVTFFLGFLAKKWSWFSKNLIPIQNLAIGIIAAIIEWLITKDFKVALTMSGLVAGGTYDIIHNLSKIVGNSNGG